MTCPESLVINGRPVFCHLPSGHAESHEGSHRIATVHWPVTARVPRRVPSVHWASPVVERIG